MTIKIKFYDTNIFLSHLDQIKTEESFLLSSVTLTELENIKTSSKKSDEVKYAARKAVRFLKENENKYNVIVYDIKVQCDFFEYGLEDTPDNRIMRCAEYAMNVLGYKDMVFISNDILCRLIARHYFSLPVDEIKDNKEEIYKGYVDKNLSEEEMSYFYSNLQSNIYGLLTNEYLIIRDETNTVVDTLKWDGNMYQAVRCKPYKSAMFGTLKPLDEIQACAMDSINTNDITVLYGKAGSGKTTLPLNYVMQALEKGKYNKCYIIYSYEPLKGAKTLGYEKGDHVQKLLYSASIGNILASKFGDILQVERLISQGLIDIIPTANIRGVEFEPSSIVLLTESQNLDVYTLKTIIQRCKDGCKQIYEGDIIEQKDTNNQETGINRLIEVFKGNKSFGCVKLKNCYRSPLTELADKM